VIIAKVSGEPVGYAKGAFLPEHPVNRAPASYYLTGVTADPAWRRCGTARLLTRRRTGWIWERESAIWRFISTRNRASLDLHRELGFDHVMIGASLTRQDDVQPGVPARTRKGAATLTDWVG
jgi:GNAT superfamily N-acetyltransferase